MAEPGQVWEVYMVRASNGALYTGVTTDVPRRFAEHAAGKRGARFFRAARAVELVYREVCGDRSTALRREAEIKSWSRSAKLELAASLQSAKAPAASRRKG